MKFPMQNPFRNSKYIFKDCQEEGFKRLLPELFAVIPSNMGHLLDAIYSHTNYANKWESKNMRSYASRPFRKFGQILDSLLSGIVLIPSAVGFFIDVTFDTILGKRNEDRYYLLDDIESFKIDDLRRLMNTGYCGWFFGLIPIYAEKFICSLLAIPVVLIDAVATAIIDIVHGFREMFLVLLGDEDAISRDKLRSVCSLSAPALGDEKVDIKALKDSISAIMSKNQFSIGDKKLKISLYDRNNQLISLYGITEFNLTYDNIMDSATNNDTLDNILKMAKVLKQSESAKNSSSPGNSPDGFQTNPPRAAAPLTGARTTATFNHHMS